MARFDDTDDTALHRVPLARPGGSPSGARTRREACGDTDDTIDTIDTGDTGDTIDTGDTGDTIDTGDTTRARDDRADPTRRRRAGSTSDPVCARRQSVARTRL